MESKPLAVELFAGTGSGTAGWVEAGGLAACFDLEYLSHHGDAPSGSMRVIQDVTTLHGSQFKDAAWIWASPPCQKYSYLAMPWSRSSDPENSKAAKALRKKWETEGPDNRLFNACFRIQREACEATCHCDCQRCRDHGHCVRCDCYANTGKYARYIPLIVENVRGAQPWVGKSNAAFGSFHLWGDVAQIGNRVVAGRDLEDIRAGRGRFGMGVATEKAVKLGSGLSWSDFGKPGYKAFGFNTENEKRMVEGVKVPGQIQGKEYAMCRTGAHGQTTLGVKVPTEGTGRRTDVGNGARFTSRDCGREAQLERIADLAKVAPEAAIEMMAGTKHGSKSNARKAASALIAKIPYALSRYIAEQHMP